MIIALISLMAAVTTSTPWCEVPDETLVGQVLALGGNGKVESVNGKTGIVVLVAQDLNAYTKPQSDVKMAQAVTNDVSSWALQGQPKPGGNVSSVNNKTGTVVLVASDFGIGDYYNVSNKAYLALSSNGGTIKGDARDTRLKIDGDGGGRLITIRSAEEYGYSYIEIDGGSINSRGISIGSDEVSDGDYRIKIDGLNITHTYGTTNETLTHRIQRDANGIISASNSVFSNAVLSVGLNIDTNSVAVLNEIASAFGGFPIAGTATSVGGLLLALAAAIAWLKQHTIKTQSTSQQEIRSDLKIYGDTTVNGEMKATELSATSLKVATLQVRGTNIEVVNAIPQSPMPDTLYFVKEAQS